MRKCKCEFWDRETKTRIKDAEGLFHQWANAYEEFSSGPGNFTVGLIELSNGKIVESLPADIYFIQEADHAAK